MANFSEKSLAFDGVGSYVTFGDSYGFLRTASFSLSVWLKTGVAQDTPVIAKTYNSSPYLTGYRLSLTTTGVRFILSSTGSVEVQATVPLNTNHWHHVVVTYDGTSLASGVRIYVDGESLSLTTLADNLTAEITTTEPLRLGFDGGSSYFSGSLDEVSVFNTAITASHVQQIFNDGLPIDVRTLTPAPQSHWSCGDGDTYPTILDRVQTVSGTMTGMTASSIQVGAPSPVKPWYSTRFDGVDDYLVAGSSSTLSSLTHSTAFSLSLWVRTLVTGNNPVFVGNVDSNGRGWELSLTTVSRTLIFRLVDVASTAEVSVGVDLTPANFQVWTHITVTYSGSNTAAGVSIYLNGSLATPTATISTGCSNSTSTATPRLGSRPDGTRFLRGYLADLVTWGTTLQASEVVKIYNQGRVSDPYTLGLTQKVTSWWPLGAEGGSTTYPNRSSNSVALTGSGFTSSSVHFETPKPVYSGSTVSNTKGLLLNGTTQYVTMGNVLNFERTDSFSVSTWFKTTLAAASTLVSKALNTGSLTGYSLSLTTGGAVLVALRGTTAGQAVVVQTVADGYNNGLWHQVTFTYNGSSLASGVKVYLDGVLLATTTTTDNLASSIVSAAPFNLGALNSSASFFAGTLNYATVWSKVLSEADVKQLYGRRRPTLPTDLTVVNLAAWWACGTGDTHPTLTDGGPNNLPGTLVGTTSAVLVLDVPSELTPTGSLYFDGSNDYIEVGNVTALSFERTDPFSVAFWLNKRGMGQSGNDAIIAKMGASTAFPGWRVMLLSSNIYVGLISNNATLNYLQVYTQQAIHDTGWIHVVATYDGSSDAYGVKVYINGQDASLTIQQNSLTTTIVSTGTVRIGTDNNSGFFSQNIAELAVYNRDLSASDVADLYYHNEVRDSGAYGPTNNLVAYWRLGSAPDVYPTVYDLAPPGNNGTLTNALVGNFNTGIYPPPTTYTSVGALSLTVLDGYLSDSSSFLSIPSANTLNPLPPAQKDGYTGSDLVIPIAGEAVPTTPDVPGVITDHFRMRARHKTASSSVFWTVTLVPDFIGTEAPSPILAGSAVVDSYWGQETVNQEVSPGVEAIYHAGVPFTVPPLGGNGLALVNVDTSNSGWPSNGDITLPSEVTVGDEVVIKDVGGLAGSKPIRVSGVQTIDDQSSRTISSARGALHLVYGGSQWRIV